MRFSALLALLLLAGCATASDKAPTAGIDPVRMSNMVRTLASDEYEGRAPGTAGEAKTVAYISEQFRLAGLEPAGENGGWTQKVPLVRTQLGKTGSVSVAAKGGRVALRVPDDVYLSTVRETARARIEGAPMVFVGYGVAAPERQWDDFKDVDLAGKVAVFLVNDPDFEVPADDPVAGRFGGQAMTYYGRWTYKFEEAARRGAVAALVVHETAGAGYGWSTVQAPGGENYNIVLKPGAPQPVLLQGWIQRSVAEDLFRRIGLDFETVKRRAQTADFRPIDLGAAFSADFPVEALRVESRNVLGRIAGSKRPEETIWFASHWDAYGVGAPDARGRRGGRVRLTVLRALPESSSWRASSRPGRGRSAASSSPPGRPRKGACSGPSIMRPARSSRWRRRSPISPSTRSSPTASPATSS